MQKLSPFHEGCVMMMLVWSFLAGAIVHAVATSYDDV
jgi:hypothetical protein